MDVICSLLQTNERKKYAKMVKKLKFLCEDTSIYDDFVNFIAQFLHYSIFEKKELTYNYKNAPK